VKNAILFDLGNTLVRYFHRPEFPAVLQQGITNVQVYLERQGVLRVTAESMWRRVQQEDHELPDHRVRPLEGRLARIFELDADRERNMMPALCRRFSQPALDRGQRYEDTLPTLEALRARGYRMAIVSNLPWGGPGGIWREEVVRQRLDEWVDAVVFCADVGWRKPARPIFASAMEQLGVQPPDCMFVGDHPEWDIAGARALGMEAVLIDRHNRVTGSQETPIRSLGELWNRLER
jgi:putative hydrolase of the HAD superfamily